MSRKAPPVQTEKKKFNIIPYIAGFLVLVIISIGSVFLYVYSKRDIARVIVDFPITERMIGLEIMNLQRFGMKAPTNATVSEQEETYSDARKQSITNLTNFLVVLQHAKDTNAPPPTKEEIDTRIEYVLQIANMEFDEYLTEGGVSKSEFRTQVRNQLIFEGVTVPMMEDVPTPGREELERYFEMNKSIYKIPENVDYMQIVVPDEDTYTIVIDKLGEGEEFADLVEEYSTDAYSKSNGGMMRAIMKTAIPDLEVANAIYPPSENYPSIDIGQIRGVFTQKSGMFIVKVLAKHDEQNPDLDGVFKFWDQGTEEYVEVKVFDEVTVAWSSSQGQSNVTAFVRKLSDRYEPQIYDRVKGNMPWDNLEQFFGRLLGPALFNRIMGFSN